MSCFSVVVFQNPLYMKDNFYITIETMHYADRGEMENVSNLVLLYFTFKVLHEKSTKLSTCIQ